MKPRTRRNLLLVCSALIAAFACVHATRRSRLGTVQTGGGLFPEGERRSRSVGDQELGVLFAGPQGEATSASEINIVFNQPIKVLESDAPIPEIRLSPALSGQWLWVGGRALRFVPAGSRLPPATSVEVEVGATLRSLDGKKLSSPYRFQFETPRPTLVRSDPPNGANGVVPETRFSLFFNQRVDPASLERHAKLFAEGQGSRRPLAFRLERPNPRAAKRVLLTPRARLPLASRIVLELDPALRGEEGELPSGRVQQVAFQTYGPLVVTHRACSAETPSRCFPGSSFELGLSNPARWSEIRRAIQVVPAVPIQWASWQEGEQATSWVSLEARFEAGKQYTVRIAGSLKDIYGQSLRLPFSATQGYGDYPPSMKIGIFGEALPPSQARAVPIAYRNLNRFEVIHAAIPETELYPMVNDPELFQALSRLPGAKHQPVNPSTSRNQIGGIELIPTKILGGLNGGVFGLATRFKDEENHPVTSGRLVKVSDLGITGKLSRHGSLFWVTRLSTAKPVSGAELAILNQGSRKRFETDAAGLVRIPSSDFLPNLQAGDSRPTPLIVARSGEDWTFERVRDTVPPWRIPVDVDLSGELPMYGLIFSDRGVYRPGDQVTLKGIVRDQTTTGNAVPRGRKLELKVLSPLDESIETRQLTTSDFGTFSTKLLLPPSGQLGTYRVLVRTGDHPGQLAMSFEIAEVRPSEFEVKVRPKSECATRGDQVEVALFGTYLYGAAMAGAKVRYDLARQPESVSLPGHRDWITDASRYYSDRVEESLPAGQLQDGEGSLDRDGILRIAPRFDLPGQRQSERVRVSAEVMDLTRQTVSASGSVLVHPGDFLLGLKTPEEVLFAAPKTLTPEVLALTPEGQRISAKHVTLQLVRRRWTLSRQDLGGGEIHTISKPVDQVVASCSLVSADRATSCPLRAAEGGQYLVVARARDAKGRSIEASVGLYGTGNGEFGWGDNDRGQLQIVANKESYQIGETAQFLIRSPFKQAEALITVERAGIYRAEQVKLNGTSPTFRVQVTRDLAPNAFVSVHVLVPHDSARTQGPAFRTGYAPIVVDSESRRLTVEIVPKKLTWRPGDQAELALALKDHRGAPARGELTVYAVDEGVLMLTGYRTPDPLAVFGTSRPLQVATLETRDRLAKVALSPFEALGEDKGNDGGGGGTGARHDFRELALFEPSLVTDAQGRARVRFTLPDALTRYRVMAVAVGTDDRYGTAETNLTVSKPLLLRPALPRFIRAGDQLEASVVVASQGVDPKTVAVWVEASGAVLEGPTKHTVPLGRDASAEVRFRLRAERAGTLGLQFSAESGALRDSVRVTRPVKVPATLETVSVSGSTQGAIDERLGKLNALRNDVGQLEVLLSSSALIGLDQGLVDLRDYPYGCTEQLASSLLPLGPLAALGRALGLPAAKDAQKTRDRLLEDLLQRQTHDDGFGMWPGSEQSSAWLTAYSLWVLNELRSTGARIPESVFLKGKAYLRRHLPAQLISDPATAAFAVDVLASMAAFDPGYTEQLFKDRARLPLFGRGLLLHALVTGKGSREARQKLSVELLNAVRVSGTTAQVVENLGDEYAALFDSPTRTQAIVLRALLAENPRESLASSLARGLLNARERGSWRSTQETAYALLALDAYRRAQENTVPSFEASFALGARELLTLDAKDRGIATGRAEFPLAMLQTSENLPLSFDVRGRGTLFYEARLKYARRTLPSRGLDAGLFVEKKQRAVSPGELARALKSVPEETTTLFSAGDLVVADLTLVAPSPARYVVLDDPLPAGFEAIDTNLQTTALWLREQDLSGSSDFGEAGPYPTDEMLEHDAKARSVWHRREPRDDRVLFFIDELPAGIYSFRYLARATSIGKFLVPPTRVEKMYEPEVFGRTRAEQVEVVP